jgi:glycosyltransferase involved in cell wall biosynthesis
VHLERYSGGLRNPLLADELGVTGRRILLTLGRMESLERYKGFDEMLEVLPALQARIPDLVWIAAGDGNDRPRLEAKARALGVWDAVRFPGFVAEEKKACRDVGRSEAQCSERDAKNADARMQEMIRNYKNPSRDTNKAEQLRQARTLVEFLKGRGIDRKLEQWLLFRSIAKSDTRSYVVETKSTMPSYATRLTADEISDLVAYLLTLKG